MNKNLNEKKTILIIDSEENFLSDLVYSLLNRYKVLTTSRSVDVMPLLTEEIVDCVLIDIDMPGLDGIELTKEIKATYSALPILIITSAENNNDAATALKYGVNGYIKKPVEIYKLIEELEQLLTTGEKEEYPIEENALQAQNEELSIKKQILQRLNDDIVLQKGFLDELVHSVNNIVIVTNIQGEITALNDTAGAMLGYKPKDLIGKPLTAILANHNLHEFMDKIIHQKVPTLECEYITKNQSKILVLLTGIPIKLENDRLKEVTFIAQDISKHKLVEEKLHNLSYYDALTQLPNHLYFEMSAKQAIATAEKENYLLAFLYIELSDCQANNTKSNSNKQDPILKETAKRLQNFFRINDFFARTGANEFIAVLSKINDKADAGLVAQRVINTISKPYMIEGNEINIGLSIGISTFPESGSTYNQLFKSADIALYKAKHSGKNQFHYYAEKINTDYTKQLELESALRRALSKEEFHMVYQPIVELRTQKIVAMESFIRWDNAELGTISPQVFIPVAEGNGMIIPIGEFAVESALKQYETWRGLSAVDFRISLNISASQLEQRNYLVNMLQKMCSKYNAMPSSIELEFTETAIMKNPTLSEKILSDLNNRGYIIVLDDFGQGYSSLSMLGRLPISILKIDKKFIKDLDDKKHAFIVRAIVYLSKSLNMNVIAEGIETENQLEYLAVIGCDYGQGYHFCKPKLAKYLTHYFQE